MNWRNLSRKAVAGLRVAASLYLCAWLLGGCVATIAPPTALIVSGTGKASAPAVALAADGTKHIVWQECPQAADTLGCAIEYYRTRLGPPLVTQSFLPPAGAGNITPDIALADDGSAFIVWTTFYSSSSTSNYDAYAALNADGSIAAVSKLDPKSGGLFGGDVSAGGPQVVARGIAVYGLYNVQQTFFAGGGTFYRQLKPLDALTGTVALDSGCGIVPTCSTVHSPRAVLDYGGTLHVAYDQSNCAFLSCSDTLYQADNSAAANMSSISLVQSSVYSAIDRSPFTVPDIAVAGNNTVFVSFAYSQTTDAVIYASGTTAASPFVTATLPLTATLNPWRMEGSVHVAAVNGQPTVAFAAKNSATGSTHEIWLFVQGDAQVTRLTNNNGDQNEPLIATLGTTAAGAAVVGWRTWDPTFVCLRDGYAYDQVSAVVQKVFSSTGGCLSTGQALATNATWASAVWVDDQYQNTRLVPWLGFNASMTFLPLVRK